MRVLAIAAICVSLTVPGTALGGPIDPYKAETEALLSRNDGHLACFPLLPDVDPDDPEAEPIAPAPARVFVLDTYYGGEQVDPAQPASRAHAVRYSDVAIHSANGPLLIVAMAHEPQVWRFELSPGVAVAGVLLLGEYEQYATGLPPGTPLGRSHASNRDDSDVVPCGDPELAELRRDQRNELDSLLSYSRSDADLLERKEAIAGHFNLFARRLADAGADNHTLGLAAGIVEEAAADLLKLQDKMAANAKRTVELETVLALPDAEGRLPLPYDGYRHIETVQDLDALTGALATIGPFELADYIYLEATRDAGFVIDEAATGIRVPSFGDILPNLKPATPAN